MRFLLGLVIVVVLFTGAVMVSVDTTAVGDNESAVTQVADLSLDVFKGFKTEDYQPVVESYMEVSLATCCESVTMPVANEKRNRRIVYMYHTATDVMLKGSWNGCGPIHQWIMS